MLELALSDPSKYKLDKKFRKFFTFRKLKNTKKYSVKMKNNIVETIKKSGWFLLLSDYIKEPKLAIKVYRNKNVVEEAFSRIKNYIKSKKFRVHSNEAVNSKLFINFLSLILISSLHNTMEKSGLYKKYTIIEMIHELNLFEVSLISGKKIFHPVNANQKKIFETFNCLYPEIADNKR
jgi:transposase